MTQIMLKMRMKSYHEDCYIQVNIHMPNVQVISFMHCVKKYGKTHNVVEMLLVEFLAQIWCVIFLERVGYGKKRMS